MRKILSTFTLFYILFTYQLANAQQITLTPEQMLQNKVTWVKRPHPRYSISDIRYKEREVIFKMYISPTGIIETADIIQSSGLEKIDQLFRKEILSSRFKPLILDGKAHPFIATQPFFLSIDRKGFRSKPLNQNITNVCTVSFNSKNWLSQEKDLETPFGYLSKPNLQLQKNELEGKNRSVDIEFKLSLKNEISDLKIIHSSGVPIIDAKLVQALMSTDIEAPRKFYQFYKLKFADHIYFNLNDCE